jgi:hypothetical protein
MNGNALAKYYSALTAEERFRLILGAGARGDKAEQGRLTAAGRCLTLTMQDHAPFAQAYYELALLTYIDLLESAAKYREALHRTDDAEILDDDDSEDELEDAEAQSAKAEPDGNADEMAADKEDRTLADRLFDLASVEGYMLTVKGDGWKLWCERMAIPSFAGWDRLPGFQRLREALAAAERFAFSPEGMLRWLNSIGPARAPALVALPKDLTAEAHAAASEAMFRKFVEWWRG